MSIGSELFLKECSFVKGVVDLSGLPPISLLEVAFAGRSNVGKSSLINALTGKEGLARASNTPGRTQELNFFNLGGELVLVDLPGYGYAEAPKAKVDAWNRLLRAYLRGRVNLRRVMMLVDSRHGLMKADREMMKMFDECAVSYQIVLTKADKLSESARHACLAKTEAEVKKHPAAYPVILMVSALKRWNIEALQDQIAGIMSPEI